MSTMDRQTSGVRRPYPFYERSQRLAEGFMAPYMRDLAKEGDRSLNGLDSVGWAICKFMYEIANFQARRLARSEMLKDGGPPEAPWIYRDLYQLDASDRERRVMVNIPRPAIELFRLDGHGWFLDWQLHIMRWANNGRKPHDAPVIQTITPHQAYQQLKEREELHSYLAQRAVS